MSVLVWVFAGIIGIDHFKVGPAAGVMSSLKVCYPLLSAKAIIAYFKPWL